MPIKPHDCGDCRLACVDCNSQICPKCMVPCPVGNRCPKCAGKFTSHVLKVSGRVLVRTLFAALAVGYGFGALNSVVPLYGFYMMIFVYLGGLAMGNLLHKVSGHKLGARVAACVLTGIVVGFTLSPMFGTLFPSTRARSNDTMVNLSNASPAQVTDIARQKWPDFIGAFQGREQEDLFSVKAPIVQTGKPTPHEWVIVKEIKGDELTCEVPKSKVAEFGNEVKVSALDIDDWEYQTADGTVGGFSRPVQKHIPQRKVDSYSLVYALFSLAAFCFGAVTPLLGGSAPNVRNFFRR